MPQERFDWLEDQGDLPADVKAAIRQMNRFNRLEIGAVAAPAPDPRILPPTPPESEAPPVPAPEPSGSDVRCVHCGQVNEAEREICWACHRYVRVQAKAAAPGRGIQDITIVLGGVTYNSGDPNTPEDVRILMNRIRKEGYTPALLEEWNGWRARRQSNPPAAGPPEVSRALATNKTTTEGGKEVEVFKGQRVSVIRIDGKVFRSDDADAAPEMKQLFRYIDHNGVTPALMEYLRQFGSKVKYRPNDTVSPSDGDVEFWRDPQVRDLVKQSRPENPAEDFPKTKSRWNPQEALEPRSGGDPGDSVPGPLERRPEEIAAEGDLRAAQERYAAARSRVIPAVLGLLAFALFILLEFLTSR